MGCKLNFLVIFEELLVVPVWLTLLKGWQGAKMLFYFIHRTLVFHFLPNFFLHMVLHDVIYM
jgi:hypothetical protein